jgi:hypothetical protein
MRNFSGSLVIGTQGTAGASSGTQAMFLSSSGQVAFGSSIPLILSGGLFQGVSPYMEVQTGVSTGAYNEAVVLRHNGNTGTFVTRSLGLLMKLSSENMPNEAPKMGGMILRSTDQFANTPSLHLVTNNSERMTITRDGNIGIGTTTPNATLDVNGNTIITGSLTVTGSLSINNTLFTSTTATANVGSTTIYSISTSSYDGAWFEYVARSGSNARAGQIMAIDSGSAVNFTETTTTDFGSTSGLSLGVYIVNGAMALTASAATNGWSIKTIVRSI